MYNEIDLLLNICW